MVEFLMAMAKNAALIFWLLTALASAVIAAEITNMPRYEWDSRTLKGKVMVPVIAILCGTNTLACITFLFESLKAAGCK
jgi:hypothetical protein